MDRTIYEEWDELEATHWWFIGRKRIFAGILDKCLDTDTPRRIADIGCGAGAMIPILSQYGKVWGLESSIIPLEKCVERGFRKIGMAKSEALPFKDSSLDALVLFDVIEHIEDDEKVIRECRRVCKKNGIIIVSVPAYQFLMSPNDIVADHKRRYSRKDMTAKLERNGFRTIKATYYNTFLFPLIFAFIMTRKALSRLSRSRPLDRIKGNISYSVPKLLNRALLSVLTLESGMIRKINFPVGHSLVCVAVKR